MAGNLVVTRHYEPPKDEAEAAELRRRVVDCLLSQIDLTEERTEDKIQSGDGQNDGN